MASIPTETRTCADCHQPFTITGGERVFYDMKELELPRRCKPCRLRRRAEREARAARPGPPEWRPSRWT